MVVRNAKNCLLYHFVFLGITDKQCVDYQMNYLRLKTEDLNEQIFSKVDYIIKNKNAYVLPSRDVDLYPTTHSKSKKIQERQHSTTAQ